MKNISTSVLPSQPKKVIEIEKLRDRIDKISNCQCDNYSEACIVLLEKLSHHSGVLMHVNVWKESLVSYSLIWGSTPLLAGREDEIRLVEEAAIAVAFLLVVEETPYTVVLQAKRKTGIDYWLGYPKKHALYDEDNFMQARLEVSGIINNLSEIERREKDKLLQTTPSDPTGLPAYVVIAEFGMPTATISKKAMRPA